MNLGELKTETYRRIGEDPAALAYYTAAEVTAALNEAQRVMALLTLCIERKVTFTLTASTVWYNMLAPYPDWLVCLAAYGTRRLRASTVTVLDSLARNWRTTTGAPVRYGVVGADLLFVSPVPASPGGVLDLTYAASPATLTADGDIPEVPDAYHADLADYAAPRVRIKEGGQEFSKTLLYFQRFMVACGILAADVRRRGIVAGYDRVPPEIRLAELEKTIAEVTGGSDRNRK